MTFRPRRQRKPGVVSRIRGLFAGEERQQATVTVLFIGAIVVVVVALLGALGLAWYQANLQPLAQVGSVQIGPQMIRDRISFETWRIGRDEDRVTAALQNQEIDATTANARQQALNTALNDLSQSGLDDYIDVIFQSQLATTEGITVTSDQVQALEDAEFAAPEKRHMWEIDCKPIAADPTNGPTQIERQAALDKCDQALAALNSGTDFATVAHQYSNGDSEPAGGDLGIATANKITDLEFGREMFDLPLNGTTGVVRGTSDGIYRIGRVTEIDPAGEQPGLRDQLFAKVSEASVVQMLTYESGASQLHDKITNDALAATPEQVKIAAIYIEGDAPDPSASPDPIAEQGEIDYSQIVFAPNDSLDDTPAVTDPSWAKAKSDAQAAYDQLAAIPDATTRESTFATLASTTSDDTDTSGNGGDVGFVTRDLPPTTVGDALFTGTFTKGDLVGGGPIQGDDAYYVVMFNDKRASVADRLQAVKTALAAPGADFTTIANQLSDPPQNKDGGEIGWLTRDELATDVGDKVWALAIGQVSDPIPIGNGQYFIKLEDKQVRAFDPDQIPNIRDGNPNTGLQSAFDKWYADKKAAAEADGTLKCLSSDCTTSDGTTDPGIGN